MTCSTLSAVIASAFPMRYMRKPGCRRAAKDWAGTAGAEDAVLNSTFLNSRALKTAPKGFFFQPYRRARRRSILLSPGLATGGEYRLSLLFTSISSDRRPDAVQPLAGHHA